MKWTELEKADKASESLIFMAKRAVEIIIETNLKGRLNLKLKTNKHLFYQISPKKLIFILSKLEQAKFIYIEPISIFAEKIIKSNLFLSNLFLLLEKVQLHCRPVKVNRNLVAWYASHTITNVPLLNVMSSKL